MALFSFTKLSLLAFVLYMWQHPNYHQDDFSRQGVNASLHVDNIVCRNLASKEEATPPEENLQLGQRRISAEGKGRKGKKEGKKERKKKKEKDEGGKRMKIPDLEFSIPRFRKRS
ncbi:Plasmodium exported protein, unknown function [Plasmodium knowlesi strain H]|uniref:SICAvar, type I n=2 Tax=Plasmodium knowlesi TaxID=5850 RepID=A0A679L416_PLAKH|nr:Plasmodium exported protein, unknown function [Plasmodium knowlesi strain H]OTN67573.1 Uncharacterized protein PKNOH_S06426100 [Plasmodium knowlesi]CAA9987534.1 Plasmodium exported protein, unknown function [Plasmodium knowlesi strain H]VVS77008.1 Plasmodium exported protein, unknown function [Plasmodium knowlesi strain H]